MRSFLHVLSSITVVLGGLLTLIGAFAFFTDPASMRNLDAAMFAACLAVTLFAGLG